MRSPNLDLEARDLPPKTSNPLVISRDLGSHLQASPQMIDHNKSFDGSLRRF